MSLNKLRNILCFCFNSLYLYLSANISVLNKLYKANQVSIDICILQKKKRIHIYQWISLLCIVCKQFLEKDQRNGNYERQIEPSFFSKKVSK